MTSDTMRTTAPATITESELFSIFAKVPIEHRSSYGAIVTSYTPQDVLLDGGNYGELEDVSQLLFDCIADDERPAEAIDMIIDDLESYLNGLKGVRADFDAFKGVHEAAPAGEEPSVPEARKAWEAAWEEHERNPRYAVPVVLTEA